MSILKARIEFYHSMAILLDAGIPLKQALEHHFPGKFYSISKRLLRDLNRGMQLFEAMGTHAVFTPFECRLTSVGEYTGRLPDIFRALEGWFQAHLQVRTKLTAGLLYPAFLYAVTIGITGIVSVFTAQVPVYQALNGILFRIVAPIPILILLKFLMNFLERTCLVSAIPLLGTFCYLRENCRFFHALGTCLSAGISIHQAIHLSADCCTAGYFREHYRQFSGLMQQRNCTFSEAFIQHQTARDRSRATASMLQIGEQTGNLDVYCLRIFQLLQEESARLQERLCKLLPFAVYLIIVVFVAKQILAMVSQYTSLINSLM